MTDPQRDALADVYGMLIDWLAQKKAAAGEVSEAEPAAADGTEPTARPGDSTPAPAKRQTGGQR